MEVEVKIDPGCREPKIVIYTAGVTPQVNELVNRLSGDAPSRVPAFRGGEVFLLRLDEIFTICTEGQAVQARSETGAYRLKARLYELEECLAGTSFVRISNSEIVNFGKVASLDLSRAGTITLRLQNGAVSYVSRRYMDRIKTYLDL